MTERLELQRAAEPLWGRSSARPGLPARIACLIVAATVLSGCSSFAWFGSKDEETVSNDPPNVIYGKADALIDKGKYKDAARAYEEVDINHPYSPEARKAILMAAYAYYKGGKYDEAIGAADRYLTLHPGTQESDLAQSIIAMSYYDRVLDPKRDQTNARKALTAYDTLLQRYPQSRYAADATNRARILRDLLAANEMVVGRYYLRHNNFLAAINRFRTVVTDFQTTEQVE